MAFDPRLFVSTVAEKHVLKLTLKDKTKIEQEVYIKPACAGTFQAFTLAQFSGDMESRKATAGVVIAECVVDENGEPHMTPAQATLLDPDVATQLMQMIRACSTVGKIGTD